MMISTVTSVIAFPKKPLKKYQHQIVPGSGFVGIAPTLNNSLLFFFLLEKLHFTITILGAFATSKLNLGTFSRTLLSSGDKFVSCLLSVVLSRGKKSKKPQGTHRLQPVPPALPFSCWAPVIGCVHASTSWTGTQASMAAPSEDAVFPGCTILLPFQTFFQSFFSHLNFPNHFPPGPSHGGARTAQQLPVSSGLAPALLAAPEAPQKSHRRVLHPLLADALHCPPKRHPARSDHAAEGLQGAHSADFGSRESELSDLHTLRAICDVGHCPSHAWKRYSGRKSLKPTSDTTCVCPRRCAVTPWQASLGRTNLG